MPSDEPVGKTYTGLVRIEDGSIEFRPCDAKGETYWVGGETERLRELYESATRQGYPGQNVVAAVIGYVKKPKPSRGAAMASPYDAQLKISDVRQVRPKNPRNNCFAADYYANGNEPFWNLQISEKEGVIELSALGQETVHVDYVAPTVEGRFTRYFARGGDQRMKVVIEEVPCEDSMAGNSYTHTVQVNYAGRVYEGCGRKG